MCVLHENLIFQKIKIEGVLIFISCIVRAIKERKRERSGKKERQEESRQIQRQEGRKRGRDRGRKKQFSLCTKIRQNGILLPSIFYMRTVKHQTNSFSPREYWRQAHSLPDNPCGLTLIFAHLGVRHIPQRSQQR